MVRVQVAERVLPTMTPSEFSRKWGPGGVADGLTERAGAQPHFIDLCSLLGVPSPADPENYCFERGMWGITGGRRFADVWMRGRFGWEYKAPGGDLSKALEQLMRYALPLENPPLLVVSDRHSIEIHTHFTGHPSDRIVVSHAELRDQQKLALLRAVFLSPDDFRPEKTTEEVTQELAGSFAHIADELRARGEPPFVAAHFLTQCIFCFFAESVGVLPGQVFRRVVQKRQTPTNLQSSLALLFKTMNSGGDFGADTIPWFNGGLFNQVDVPLLKSGEIEKLGEVAGMSWASIDPSILGTLFERGLDPAKRQQLGAHFTDAATIERLVDPVVRQPLLAEWNSIKRSISGLLSKRDVLTIRAKGIPSATSSLKARYGGIRSQASRAGKAAKNLQSGFMDRLQSFRVLDPACGSGNFLFLALKALKDVEHQVNQDSEELGIERQLPVTGPHNVLGIEINEYAAELARATVWIGELQWRKEHGYGWKENPILDPLDQIECRDAVLTAEGLEALWPPAEVLVSNPPFLGDKRMHRALGADYTAALREAYADRVPGAADLVCYWFERARGQIEDGHLKCAGLVATNSIRQSTNRKVLERITSSTKLYEAWSDLPWINDGAAVNVSLVCFGESTRSPRLDGVEVEEIYTDLKGRRSGEQRMDMTAARELLENAGVSFFGLCLAGSFEVDGNVARKLLMQPNPHGKPNSDVLVPLWSGKDLTDRNQDTWTVDFGTNMSEEAASMYERPFAWVSEKVLPARIGNRRESRAKWWYRHGETRPGMRRAMAGLSRAIVTVERAKHRFFVWLPRGVAPEHRLVVLAREDDATFGVLSSRVHLTWVLAQGSTLVDRPGYNTKVCFLNFPFPLGLTPMETGHQRTEALPDGALIPSDLTGSALVHAKTVAQAAKQLVDLRDRWLNPPEWCERTAEVAPLGMSQSPYPDRIVAREGFEKALAGRTLTNLYNDPPRWLRQAQERLDAAVSAAYGWTDYTPAISDEEILRRLLTLNFERARQQPGQRELPLLGLVSNKDSEGENATTAVRRKKRA